MSRHATFRYVLRTTLVLALLAGAANAPAHASDVGGAGERAFDEALAALESGDSAEAARGFFAYHRSTEEGERREWARLLMAVALADDGYSHAALEHFAEVAHDRAVPELLPEALERILKLEEAGPVMLSRALDRVVLDADLGFLPARLADWVNYEKGREDYRHGDVAWAERSFARLTPQGESWWRAALVRARWRVSQGDWAGAEAALRELLVAYGELTPETGEPATVAAVRVQDVRPDDDRLAPAPALVRDAWRTLARVLFEQRRFDEAAAAYDRIDSGAGPDGRFTTSAADGARLLLEKAWCAYYRGRPREVLGHLHALAAPAFRDAVLPERFVLAGLTYENLCHWERALAVVQQFRRELGEAAQRLGKRRPIAELPRVRRAVEATDSVSRLSALVAQLRRERERALAEEGPLGAHLATVYDAGLSLAEARRERVRSAALREISREILRHDEQMNLLAYEVAVERWRRVKGRDYLARGPQDAPPVPLWGEAVYFEADGEYWNEELDLYRVHIDDRCARPRAWE